MQKILRSLPLVAGFLLTLAGCKPDYPACETDKDCVREGKPQEYCVARKCQQCRDTNDCKAGQECSNGKCSAIPGYCTDKSQCAAGQECIANRCRACDSDSECPSGQKCMAGQCKKAECSTDNDCPQDKECQNGTCIGKPPKPPAGPVCALSPVYFGFDQAALTGEANSTLNTNAECLKKAKQSVDLVGRADPRGTTEYNMALSDRRAQAVKDYLQRVGIEAGRLTKVPRGALDASGTEDGSWAKDRRVDFDWK